MDSSIGHGWGSNLQIAAAGKASPVCLWTMFRSFPRKLLLWSLLIEDYKGSFLIPFPLFQLQKLEVLDLSSNNFSGPLPSMTALPSLRYLNLSANHLAGSVDSGLCRSSRYLETIDFTYDKLSGDIPFGFGNCSSLRYLSFESNFLTEELPRYLFRLSKLTQLNLRDNMLSASLVTELGNLSNLVNLDISFNNFLGSLPNVFHNLKKIKQFSIASNKFSGSLPPTLSNCPTLLVLNLQGNSMTGPISLNCFAMARLSTLNLGSNQFSGPIPEKIASCRRLSIGLSLVEDSSIHFLIQALRGIRIYASHSLLIVGLSRQLILTEQSSDSEESSDEELSIVDLPFVFGAAMGLHIHNSSASVCDCQPSSVGSGLGRMDSNGVECKKMVDFGRLQDKCRQLCFGNIILSLNEEACMGYSLLDITCIIVTSQNDGFGLCTIKRTSLINRHWGPSRFQDEKCSPIHI
ncbi:Leucine-rich repeat [Dillenia turbinata]|uniref:Leucine-rich repeat n=1 Tax=Dillenia turbinata TaxID=194707 RepID=A0AAN8Z766_9MAGN